MNSDTGFFILEVAAVIFVIILVIAMSWPFLWFHDKLGIQHDLQKIYNAVLYLQQKAKSNFETEYLTFDIAKRTFTYNQQTYTLSSNVDFGTAPGIKGPPSAPKKDILTPITFDSKRIAFYPDGTISAGIVYMFDRKTKETFALTSSVSYISFIRKYKFIIGSGWTLIDS